MPATLAKIVTCVYPELTEAVKNWGGHIEHIPNGPHSHLVLPDGWLLEEEGARGAIHDTLGRVRATTLRSRRESTVSIQLMNWFKFEVDPRCWGDDVVTVMVFNGNGHLVHFADSAPNLGSSQEAVIDASQRAERELMKLYPDWHRTNMLVGWEIAP